MIVVFLGADGSGKSTIINSFVDEINCDWLEIKYVHFRPTYLLKRKRDNVSVTDPHAGKSRGFMVSLLKLLLFTFEYNYAFYFHYRKENQLVIFDRYFYDILADPKRVKISLPPWIIRFFEKLIPTPDIVFYLHAPVDILYGRKQEISKNELYKILQKYSNMAEIYNFNSISTEEPLKNTLKKILIIYKKLRVIYFDQP
jgi:thymidylate kinase